MQAISLTAPPSYGACNLSCLLWVGGRLCHAYLRLSGHHPDKVQRRTNGCAYRHVSAVTWVSRLRGTMARSVVSKERQLMGGKVLVYGLSTCLWVSKGAFTLPAILRIAEVVKAAQPTPTCQAGNAQIRTYLRSSSCTRTPGLSPLLLAGPALAGIVIFAIQPRSPGWWENWASFGPDQAVPDPWIWKALHGMSVPAFDEKLLHLLGPSITGQDNHALPKSWECW
jgi:hypothetical protein